MSFWVSMSYSVVFSRRSSYPLSLSEENEIATKDNLMEQNQRLKDELNGNEDSLHLFV